MQICKNSVPLFKHSEDLNVETKTIGKTTIRQILCRSDEMNGMILRETDILTEDWNCQADDFDGLIYMMFLKEEDKVLPLYIGKAETIGKGNRNLSTNIVNLHSKQSNFARWEDNYAYHIGDLSSVAVPGHDFIKSTIKYRKWAETLFVEFPVTKPKLKHEVYFWTTAWSKTNIGIWEEFGPIQLTFLEYLLIGVASSVFHELLLNMEGQNRSI